MNKLWTIIQCLKKKKGIKPWEDMKKNNLSERNQSEKFKMSWLLLSRKGKSMGEMVKKKKSLVASGWRQEGWTVHNTEVSLLLYMTEWRQRDKDPLLLSLNGYLGPYYPQWPRRSSWPLASPCLSSGLSLCVTEL